MAGAGGGGLWFGSLGPADIAEPTVLIRTFNIANLRTAYFLDRKGRSKFILLKVYALLHKKHYKLPHVAEALRGNVVKKMNLSSLYQLSRHIVIEETDASRAARLWRGNFHRRIFTLNTWLRRDMKHSYSFLISTRPTKLNHSIHTSGKGTEFIPQFTSGELSC